MTSRQREREEFSLRLRQTLAGAGLDERSPTFVAKEFNRRFGGPSVTVHAARKWLLGEAIPSQDKVQALAAWLGVRPEWLRYGETDATSNYALKEPALSETDLDVIRQFRRLNTGHRQAVREIMLSLLRIEQRK